MCSFIPADFQIICESIHICEGMNGNFPPQEGYRHELAYESNTAQECQGRDNANAILTHKGEVTDNGSDGERSGDFSHTIWPPTAQNKVRRSIMIL